MLNFFQRVSGIIFSPGKVMADLAEKPRVLFPVILIALTVFLVFFIRMPLYEEYLMQTVSESADYYESVTGQKMTPDMIRQSAKQGLVWGLAFMPVSSLVFWVVMTLVFFAVIKIGGGQGKLKQYFSVVGYSYVIPALYYLLVLVVSFITNDLYIEVPMTSLANFLDSGLQGTAIYGIFKGIDVFSIWQYIVIAIGLFTVSGFKRKWPVYVIVAGYYAVNLAITAITTVMSGRFV